MGELPNTIRVFRALEDRAEFGFEILEGEVAAPAVQFERVFYRRILRGGGGYTVAGMAMVICGFGMSIVLQNVAFLIFALISVWRCAPNTDYAPMNAAARIVVVLILAIIAVQFINGLLKGKKMIDQRRQQQSFHQHPAHAGLSSPPMREEDEKRALPAVLGRFLPQLRATSVSKA